MTHYFDPHPAPLCTQFVDNIAVDIRTCPVAKKRSLTWGNRDLPQNPPHL